MKTICFRQSSGPIGDMFFTAHYMFHQKQLGNKVIAAIPTNLPQEVRDLYNHFNFMDEIIELPFFLDDDKFLSYCLDKNYKPCRFLKEMEYLKGIKVHPLGMWFKDTAIPRIDTRGCVGFQVASSAHYDRPIVPHLNSYVNLVVEAGLKPVFFGTQKDEGLFIKNYPDISARFFENIHAWRFGKDSLIQTIANLRNLYGHVVFSSGTSPIAVFQGVPVLELWTTDQSQYYSPLVHYMLGSPIHHLTQAFDSVPNKNLIKSIFPRLKQYSQYFYNMG
jgi:hypothetical protein